MKSYPVIYIYGWWSNHLTESIARLRNHQPMEICGQLRGVSSWVFPQNVEVFQSLVFFDMWAVIKTHQWHSIKNSLLNRDRYTGVSYDPYISLSSIISPKMQQKKRNFGHCSCEGLTSKSEKLKVNKTTPRVHSPLPKTQNPTPRGHHRQTLLGAVMQQPTMVACVLRLADGLIKCPPQKKNQRKAISVRKWEGIGKVIPSKKVGFVSHHSCGWSIPSMSMITKVSETFWVNRSPTLTSKASDEMHPLSQSIGRISSVESFSSFWG